MNEIIGKHRQNRKILYIAMAFIVFDVVAAYFLFENGLISNLIFVAILFISFLGAAFANIKFWRCPSCHEHLGNIYFGLQHPKHCPNCGIKLADSEKSL